MAILRRGVVLRRAPRRDASAWIAPVEAAAGRDLLRLRAPAGTLASGPRTNNTTPRRPALCRCGSAGARQCADLRPSVRSATAPKISQARPSEGATSPLFTLFGHETCSTACDGSLGRADSSQPHASTLQTPAVLVLSPGLRPLFCSRRRVPHLATRSLTPRGSAHRLSRYATARTRRLRAGYHMKRRPLTFSSQPTGSRSRENLPGLLTPARRQIVHPLCFPVSPRAR